ncbi:NADH-quinone oxidoreductase subunit C [Paludibacterium yongneupense]|uniref:NADH-quinone oxidoreductase subunit C n=1 Tax=Paludibacterium yongneupense TaxID=400061 RepID=UPI0004045705|nr:NADH-quinone oxidoreductase subunit C [Paludibacterium yongneupense]
MIMPASLEMRLAEAAASGIRYTSETDAKGIACAWCTLARAEDLLPAAALLKAMDARLSTITVFQPKAPPAAAVAEGEEAPPAPTFLGGDVANDGSSYEIDYHFDLDGDTVTLVAHVPAGGAVDSLTPLFRGADWPEREMMEIYAVGVKDHPDPRRLFLDPGIEGAVLERLIPLSTLINSATTKGLWEKIMAQTGSPT